MTVSLEEDIKQLIEQEVAAVRNIPIENNGFEAALELIYQKVHCDGGKVLTSGVGKAGEMGQNIATTFCSTGTPATFLHPLEAVHGDLGIIQKNDLLLVISNSGKTREILELIPLAKGLVPNIPIICLTGNKPSPITALSDIVLHTGHPKEVCPIGLTPTTSTTVMGIVGDILVVMMMKKTHFSKEEYGKRHHGGYIGSVLRETEAS